MKNSILRFGQLLEGLQLDDELFNDIIQDLKDELDIEFSITKGYFDENSKAVRLVNENPTSSKDNQHTYFYLTTINLTLLREKDQTMILNCIVMIDFLNCLIN